MQQRKKKELENKSPIKTKRVLILKGNQTSQIITDVLQDISLLFKPNCKHLTRKNDILPFEDINSIEFLSQKNDCSLFAMGSHSKKRPHNLILGRLYDDHLLDMVEFGVESNHSLKEFSSSKKGIGSKPILVFNGDQWQNNSLFTNIQNLFIDMFRGDKTEKISLKGLDHVLSFSCADDKIYMRSYLLNFQKADNSKVPLVSLVPMGPFLDLSVRRSQLASPDMWKTACKKDPASKPAKVKNISRAAIGDKLGRIHMKPQSLDKMGGKRVEALRQRKRPLDADGNNKYGKEKKIKK